MDEASPQSPWLIEPPTAGQVVVQVAPGEGVELNARQQAALEALLASLHASDEVSGFGKCLPQEICSAKLITVPNCLKHEVLCGGFSSCVIQSSVGGFGA